MRTTLTSNRYLHNYPEVNYVQKDIKGIKYVGLSIERSHAWNYRAETLDKEGADIWLMSPPCQPYVWPSLFLMIGIVTQEMDCRKERTMLDHVDSSISSSCWRRSRKSPSMISFESKPSIDTFSWRMWRDSKWVALMTSLLTLWQSVNTIIRYFQRIHKWWLGIHPVAQPIPHPKPAWQILHHSSIWALQASSRRSKNREWIITTNSEWCRVFDFSLFSIH